MKVILTLQYLLDDLCFEMQDACLNVDDFIVQGQVGALSAVLSAEVLGARVKEIDADGGVLKIFATVEVED